jgi:putative ABC transport system permease protein
MTAPESLRLLFFLALRNMIRQRRRTAAALLAISLGVAALIGSGGFITDIFRQLAEAIIRSQTGHVQIARPEFFTSGSRSPEKHLIEEPAAVAERLRARADVVEVAGRIQFSALLGNGRSDLGVLVEGIEPDREARIGTYVNVLRGRRLAGADESGVMLGEGAATSLSLQAGAPVSLVSSTAAGAVNSLDLEVTGVIQSFSKEYDARVVKIPLPAAQSLLDVGGVNVLVVLLADTARSDEVGAAIRADLAGSGLEVRLWHELSDFYAKSVTLYERQFGVLRLIILIMVALSVVNTLNAAMFERTGEFGTMRALGNRSGEVLRLVLLEGALLGVAGALLGVVLGVALAAVVSAIGIPMPPPPNSNIAYVARIVIEPGTVAQSFAIGVAAAALGAVVPALRMARIPVVDALRHAAH